jgi:hypothetical protein
MKEGGREGRKGVVTHNKFFSLTTSPSLLPIFQQAHLLHLRAADGGAPLLR